MLNCGWEARCGGVPAAASGSGATSVRATVRRRRPGCQPIRRSARDPCAPARPDVLRLRPDDAVGPALLAGMGDPAADPADGEGGREEAGRRGRGRAGAARCRTRRWSAAGGRACASSSTRRAVASTVARQSVERHVAGPGEEPLGGGGQHVGPRIAHLVDAVAEAHQLLAAGDLVAQHRLGPRRLADLEHHVEGRTGRAAVERALERAERADHRRDQVGPGGGDHARGEGRRVQAVVDHGVEVGLERREPVRGRATSPSSM